MRNLVVFINKVQFFRHDRISLQMLIIALIQKIYLKFCFANVQNCLDHVLGTLLDGITIIENGADTLKNG